MRNPKLVEISRKISTFAQHIFLLFTILTIPVRPFNEATFSAPLVSTICCGLIHLRFLHLLSRSIKTFRILLFSRYERSVYIFWTNIPYLQAMIVLNSMYLVINSWLKFSLQQVMSTNIGQLLNSFYFSAILFHLFFKICWIKIERLSKWKLNKETLNFFFNHEIFNNNYIFSLHNVIVIFFISIFLVANKYSKKGRGKNFHHFVERKRPQ